jgi:predicted Zn finger-like uncharacterized protein
MKFVCERCHTRYSIADDKVRQKILKIRCKTCENVITVRDPASSVIEPAVSAAQPPPPPARGATPPPLSAAREWFVAVNGDQQGPLTRGEAAKRVFETRPDDEVYVWKEGLDGWKPPHDVPPIQQELNAIKSRSAAPPRPPGRTTVPPARSAPAHAASARSAPATAPAAHANQFSEEDHTQIQPFDAGMLAPDFAARPAVGSGSVLPFKGRATNGAPAAAPANLDGLFADLPPAGPAGAFAPAPAGLHATHRADSGLSRLTGFAGFMSRNPGLKFVAAGAVVVVLIALVVIVLVRMPGDQKPPPPVATEKPEPSAPIDILPGRPPEEKASVKSVGQTQPVAKGPSIGPARGKGRAAVNKGPRPVLPPPASGPASLEPAPIGETKPGTAAPGERVVPRYQPKAAAASPATSGAPRDGMINAVVNKHENKAAITACYERELKRDDKLRSGRLAVTVNVGMSGMVKAVSISAPPEFSRVEACIKNAVRRWSFPANSEDYQIEFPLIMAGSL